MDDGSCLTVTALVDAERYEFNEGLDERDKTKNESELC